MGFPHRTVRLPQDKDELRYTEGLRHLLLGILHRSRAQAIAMGIHGDDKGR